MAENPDKTNFYLADMTDDELMYLAKFLRDIALEFELVRGWDLKGENAPHPDTVMDGMRDITNSLDVQRRPIIRELKRRKLKWWMGLNDEERQSLNYERWWLVDLEAIPDEE